MGRIGHVWGELGTSIKTIYTVTSAAIFTSVNAEAILASPSLAFVAFEPVLSSFLPR